VTAASDRARVGRLLAWYPPGWRARYGEEFAELLLDELGERPWTWRRTADVAACGLRARLAGAGLAGHPIDPAAAARAALATIACSAAAFGLTGAAMWSQLAIGLQWSVPRASGLTQALDLMTAAMAILVTAAVLAAVPLAWSAVATAVRGQGRPLLRPALLTGASALFLIVGGRHFQNGWPGTGGHLLAHQGLVPGGVAAFFWATTMWVTSYWAHPAMLAAFPAARLAWMALSPAAAMALVTGAATLMRRAEISPRALRYERLVANLAGAGMAVFAAGALCWLLSAGPGTRTLFRAGAIDRAGLAVLALAGLASLAAARHARPRPTPSGSATPAGPASAPKAVA